jgi:hypothetical protein
MSHFTPLFNITSNASRFHFSIFLPHKKKTLCSPGMLVPRNCLDSFMVLLVSLNDECNFYRESNLLIIVRCKIEGKGDGLVKVLPPK